MQKSCCGLFEKTKASQKRARLGVPEKKSRKEWEKWGQAPFLLAFFLRLRVFRSLRIKVSMAA
jgi:hypothetical protein